MLTRLKGLLLKLAYYGGTERYWNLRWRIGYDLDVEAIGKREVWFTQIKAVMEANMCQSILDVGCGEAWLRGLYGYLGLDRSLQAFKNSKLQAFMMADATRHIPLPDKSFDCVSSFYFLMHIPPEQIGKTVEEMKRVAKHFIFLKETVTVKPRSHCFNHNYGSLFGDFKGKVIMLQ